MRERWFIRRILVLGSAPGMRTAAPAWRPDGPRQAVRAGDRCRATPRRGPVDQPLSLGDLRRQRIWGIVVAETPADTSDGTGDALLDCKLRGVPVFDEAGFCEQHLGRIDLDGVHADWLLFADGFASGRVSNAAKRAFDICVSLALLLLTLPLMLLIAALVRIDSPGPGALPPAARRPARQAVHPAEVPQHDNRRRGRAAIRAGRPSRTPGSPASAASSARCGSMNCRN